MDYYAGIDVSLEASSICVLDASGKIVKEAKLSSEPEALIVWFQALPFSLAPIRTTTQTTSAPILKRRSNTTGRCLSSTSTKKCPVRAAF